MQPDQLEESAKLQDTIVVVDKDSTRYGEKATVVAVDKDSYTVEYADGKQETISTVALPTDWDGLTTGDRIEKQGQQHLVLERLQNTVLLSKSGSDDDVGEWYLITSLQKVGYARVVQ